MNKRICVFGSARDNLDPKYYKQAYDIAYKAVALGYDTISGAGPGIMESANKGCQDAGGKSFGARINLPFEQYTNEYIDKLTVHERFFKRKKELTRHTDAFIVMPGGFGTMDELFEILTLIQCEKIKKKQVILVGKKFWAPMIIFIYNSMLNVTIGLEDADLFNIVDSADEALELLR